jgi:two-component system sensor histidine kinase MprB
VSVTRFVNLSFQARLTLLAAAAVAMAIIGPGLLIYHLIESFLIGGLDGNLQALASRYHVVGVSPNATYVQVDLAPVSPLSPSGYVQFVDTQGQVLHLADVRQRDDFLDLPTTPLDVRVAAGQAPGYFRNAYVANARDHTRTHVRVFTTSTGDGLAIQVAEPRDDIDSTLGYLRVVLTFIAACGIVLALILGRLLAQVALAPIQRLRGAVDHVTQTGDMSQRVPVGGKDELSRLASHFNRMLAALDRSLSSQRQLVADASHELRTPLASVRTNVEVLKRSPDLSHQERERMLDDVLAQVQQLSQLVQDLIDLARGDQVPMVFEEVRLDWVAAEAVERAARNWPTVHFQRDLHETVVFGDAHRLERAISNLLDNAGKWSPAGGTVEVRVADHELTVRDHGPGIAPEDLPHVFDRFWRAPTARGLPGSGLGLAIVRQVVEAHGATVTAELPPDGGTLMRLRFVPSVARTLTTPRTRAS